MTTANPENSTASHPSQCYCLNPDCQHPENPRDAVSCHSCGSELLLSDRYRAIHPLGQGGFGRTFRGVDESNPNHPDCAIKQFFPKHSSTTNQEKAAELFEQEAQRLKTLGHHSQIPQLLDYFSQDNRQYLVQEFIHGQNLAAELASVGPFSELKIRLLLRDLLPVLQFIHSHQVIHRDIKPENIIRRPGYGNLVLVDFGAAKFATETILERTGTVIGSAAYTAPEQVRGKAVFASDLYSLGVTCIHLLTQIPPFDLLDSHEDAWVWQDYLNGNRSISKPLAKILNTLLQRATKRRYQSAEAVLKDLNPSQRGSKVTQWLVASTVLIVGWAGIRYLVSPVTQQVSTRNPVVTNPIQEKSPTPSSTQTGGLFATINGQQQVFPLEHTQVATKITGNVSRVEVTQTFTNPFDHPLEAVYKFPLPDEAAVDDMEIQLDDRIIRGVIKKRQEAKQIYEKAKKAGKTAGLLEQERANVFTQSLANIKPGESIQVTIRYTDSLKFEGGDYEFAFPMVVAPRYTAGNSVGSAKAPTTNSVGSKHFSASSAKAPTTNKTLMTNVAYAAEVNPPIAPPGRSGHDIDVTVEIDAGVPISNVRSPSHPVTTQQTSSTVRVELADQETIPNKDLILRYQVAGADTQATVLTQADERGGHFATYLIPAIEYQQDEIVPKDVVFLVDTSGSQSGSPIVQSKELMRQFIQGLNPQDTFTIIDFANSTTQLSDKPLANTPQNRKKALNYINRLDANGGTELMNGIDTVLNFPAAPAGRLRSVVLLTDGLIGDDEQIIAEIRDRLKPGNRLYSFGVGSSTNRFLIERLAELGRGTAEVVPPNESAEVVAQEFFQEINNPVLTNIQVSWEGTGNAPEFYPQKVRDLFANQPLVVFGRKGDRTNGKLKISGTVAGGQPYETSLDVNFDEVRGNGAIAQLWGRARIKALMNQMYGRETPEVVEAVTDTALNYRLMSKYTSFVAVTEEIRVDSKDGKKVDVPVETPEGMDNQGTDTPSSGNTASVPEPDQIIGNLFTLLLLIVVFGIKPLKKVIIKIRS
ncbi:MAG: VIT domain-containing protein [Coleofasciculus sp. A1-SPW-01]|uniref:protein kinase domain-containing protein n=1 Tax=Coleofasciculus sp. A1-SPW-01 TaxID=3070819 RepID=UPI0032FF177A